jgi:hypothetical protein
MDRRTSQKSDTGHRRRDTDRIEAFALLRDKILLGLGSLIVGGLSVAAVFGHIHSTDIALACLTVGAGLLGAPTILRWDEGRGRR